MPRKKKPSRVPSPKSVEPRHRYAEQHDRANAALLDISPVVFGALPLALDHVLGIHIRNLSRSVRDDSSEGQVNVLWVAVQTLLRLKQELNAVRDLLGLGYVLQALALSANMTELAYDLAYVRDLDERAADWLKHRDLEKSPWKGESIRRRMREAQQNLELSPEEVASMVEHDYTDYSRQCAAKHGNPVLSRKVGGAFHNGRMVYGPQEYQTVGDTGAALFTMEMVYRMVMMAVRTTLKFHVPEPARSTLTAELEPLEAVAIIGFTAALERHKARLQQENGSA